MEAKSMHTPGVCDLGVIVSWKVVPTGVVMPVRKCSDSARVGTELDRGTFGNRRGLTLQRGGDQSPRADLMVGCWNHAQPTRSRSNPETRIDLFDTLAQDLVKCSMHV